MMTDDRADSMPGRETDSAEDRQPSAAPIPVDPERLLEDQAVWLERSRAAWDARAERWDARATANANGPDRAADLDRIWEALRLHPGARLLDAGCGSGQLAIAFAERGAQVTALDLSPRMIRRAQDHAADRGVTIAWRVGDVTTLADPLAIYDAIHARVLLQFVPDVRAVLHEFRRVLKPGGRLLASVPGALSPIYRASWQRHLPGGDPGNNYLLPWELENLLREYGWRIVGGWGEWGEDYSGVANEMAAVIDGADRALQQATATTWTTIAV